ncbi:hypothetical protein H6F74_24815 [Trichocoleus sp. FACHB-90]|uniref:hypothetical protein n=1 Tax=Cyanophyceae TaxID=3028117 RepID=UPI001684B8BF|nr:hypothetical protein [Trichocoleus sp. FACHB-90]MBD1929440.1 hypothetical protein [Trichocoleus sp. FACHB-90]
MTDEASRQTATEAIEERPTDRTHTATIEMMNVHECFALNYFLPTGIDVCTSFDACICSGRYENACQNAFTYNR